MERNPIRGVGGWLRSVAPQRRTLKTDAMAGLPVAIGSVPDGMAASVLAGVNPIHGLYASFAGPVAGGLSASTKLMVITTTSAAALAAGSAVEHLSPEERPAALFLLTLMAGAAMIAAGLLRMGRFTRFVSHSVMVGFLSGVVGQHHRRADPRPHRCRGQRIGRRAEGVGCADPSEQHRLGVGPRRRRRVRHHHPALRTRIAAFGAVVALAIPTIAVIVSGADVARVEDQGDIPRGSRSRRGPSCRRSRGRCSPGRWRSRRSCSCKASASPSRPPTTTAPAPTPTPTSSPKASATSAPGSSRANPSAVRSARPPSTGPAGARTRWASIFSGIWVLLILALFSGVVGAVAMPTLAALLIYAAAGSLRFGQIATIWRTGLTSQIAIATTFVATLLLPVATAVGLGVAALPAPAAQPGCPRPAGGRTRPRAPTAGSRSAPPRNG